MFRFAISGVSFCQLLSCVQIVGVISTSIAVRASDESAVWVPNINRYQPTAADFVMPLDDRPAAEQLQQAIAFIQNEINEAREYGDSKTASRMKARLQAVNDGNTFESLDGRPRLHVVGLYNGSATRDRKSTATVHVSDAGGPVTLCLCSYERVHWTVKVSPTVDLQRLILAGAGRQQVEGLPKNVSIEEQINPSTGEYASAYKFHPFNSEGGWCGAAEKLHRLTGLEIASRLGEYQFTGQTFVLGPRNPEWVNQMKLSFLRTTYGRALMQHAQRRYPQIVNTVFPMIRRTENEANGLRPPYAVATGGIFGPYSQTLQTLKNPIVQIALARTGLFSIDRFGIVTVNADSGIVDAFDVAGLGKTRVSLPMTIDSDSHRMYLWSGSLSAVDLDTRQVTTLRKGNPSVRAFTCSPASNRFFAICTTPDEDSFLEKQEICTFDLSGREVNRKRIPNIIPVNRFSGPPQLFPIADKLLIVPNRGKVVGRWNFVVDPESGQLLFACKSRPR